MSYVVGLATGMALASSNNLSCGDVHLTQAQAIITLIMVVTSLMIGIVMACKTDWLDDPFTKVIGALLFSFLVYLLEMLVLCVVGLIIKAFGG